MNPSRPPARPRATDHRRAGGFTLLEVLMVVFIIAVLAASFLTVLIRSKSKASAIRSRADLSLIETALAVYKDDFGDIPRFPDLATMDASITASTGGYWLDQNTDRGARLLCRALLGPSGAGTVQAGQIGDDGADGPGFRLRRNMVNGQVTGKVWGPYVQPGKFKVEVDATATAATTNADLADAKLLDHNGSPILYYPGRLAGAAPTVAPNGLVGHAISVSAAATAAFGHPVYNAADNEGDTTPLAAGQPLPYACYPHLLHYAHMATLLGDGNINGTLDAGEVGVPLQPFLLWSAGDDGQFGFGYDLATGKAKGETMVTASTYTFQAAGLKTDDVTNFDIPPAFLK